MQMIKIALDSKCKMKYANKYKNQWMIFYKKKKIKINFKEIFQLLLNKYFKVIISMKYYFAT